jgi:photosystem II stability/assembly factor-like uncharacterized protein
MKYLSIIGALVLAGCATGNSVSQGDQRTVSTASESSYNCTQERVYAALLSTRIHRLSGQNPVVGVFDSRDGGSTWNHTGWPQGRHFSIITEPGTCGVVRYVAAGNGLFRTTDDGRTWRITTDWRQTEIQGAAVNTMDPKIILSATPYGIYRSTDRGDTWSEASSGLDQRFTSSIRFDRTNARVALAGTESGVYISEDGGSTWRPTNLDKPVRSVRQSPDNPGIWVAGLQHSGGAISRDFGRTWQLSPGLDGKTIYQIEFGVEPEELWAGGWEVGVWYSPDLGRTWEHRSEGIAYPSIHSIAVSRAKPGTLWAGSMGGGLFRSDDHGKTWKASNPELFDAGQIWDLYIDTEQ